jgi:hypothetical protein
LILVVLAQEARIHAGRHDDPFAQLRSLYLFPEEDLSRQELANRLLLYAHFVALPQGDTADALARGRRAVRLTRDSPLSAASFATILAGRGRWEEVRQLLEPWHHPSAEMLAAAAVDNRRVYDDLNRSGTRLTLLLGRAMTHTGEPGRGLALVCEAAGTGAAPADVRKALEEIRQAGVPEARCVPAEG